MKKVVSILFFLSFFTIGLAQVRVINATNDLGDIFELSFSKQGLVELKTSSQDQAIEIVRRRIDEVGTNEPNILKRGNNRILVELPGLDDPMRVKSLLGKTANLTFRFVTSGNEDSFGSEKLKYEDSTEDSMVSKRIILSGDNLLDAQPPVTEEEDLLTQISKLGDLLDKGILTQEEFAVQKQKLLEDH